MKLAGEGTCPDCGVCIIATADTGKNLSCFRIPRDLRPGAVALIKEVGRRGLKGQVQCPQCQQSLPATMRATDFKETGKIEDYLPFGPLKIKARRTDAD